MLQEVFPDATVHQDIWHATQRVKRAATVKCSKVVAADNGGNAKQWRRMFKTDFMKVFRADGDEDVSIPRSKTTPEADHMLKKYDQFVSKYIEGQKIPSSLLKELSNLRPHIAKRCLSGQPPKCGTNRNENIHKHANVFFNGRGNLSVQLFEALMDTFIYETNRRIAKVKQIDLNVAVLEDVKSKLEVTFRCDNDLSLMMDVGESVLSDNDVGITASNVKFLCEARDVLASYGFSKNDIQELLTHGSFRCVLPHQIDSSFNLLTEVVRQYKFQTCQTDDLLKVLLDSAEYWLGVSWNPNEKLAFSEKLLNWIKENIEYLMSHVQHHPNVGNLSRVKDDLNHAKSLTTLIDDVDITAGNLIESIVIKAFANVLGCPVLLFSSNPICQNTIIVPLEIKVNSVVCVGYTKDVSEKLNVYQLTRNRKSSKCTCGWKQSQNRLQYCNTMSCSCFKNGLSCTDIPVCYCYKKACAQYVKEDSMLKDSGPCKCGSSDLKGSSIKRCVPFSRCKCVLEKRSCNGCKCQGCDNKYGKREIAGSFNGSKVSKSKLSERKKISLKVKRWSKKSDIHQFATLGITPKDSSWFFSETILLADLKRRFDFSSSSLWRAYNLVVELNQDLGRAKSESEIVAKVKHIMML